MSDGPDSSAPPILDYASSPPGPLENTPRLPERPPYWASGRFLVMRTDAELPMRCIKCNRPTRDRIRKRLLWIDGEAVSERRGLRRAPFVSIAFSFISLIQSLFDRHAVRTPAVNVPLCRRHLVQVRLVNLLTYSVFPVTTLVLNVSPLRSNWSVLGAVVSFCVSALLWTRPRPVKAVHVGIGFATLAGVGPGYLNSVSEPAKPTDRSPDDALVTTQALRDHMGPMKRRNRH